MNDPDSGLHPSLDARRTEWVDVGQGHQLYVEESGPADGVPVVYLHGGPGSGCTPGQRRFFDPAIYRVVLFDQRGCGRSRPAGMLEANTTGHLVDDLEVLRQHLGIARWVVFGGSWGSSLALAYARRYPQPVLGLVLRGVFLARICEVESFAYNLRNYLPQTWQAMASPFGIHDEQAARDFDLASQCARTVLTGPPQAARETARAWLQLEAEAMAMTAPNAKPGPPNDPLSSRTQVYMHYLLNRFFLRDGELLDGLDTLQAIPIEIVQGALDPVCPPISAWELAQRLTNAHLQIVPQAGHGAFEPAISRALVSALQRLQQRLS